FEGFQIRESHAIKGAMTLVSPDVATCPQCTSELDDPTDRRYGYPFINCTNCGPRFTIIQDVPYDRPATTMRDFPMCPECAAEYGDPENRRFHAQPDACFVCGPRLYLNQADAPDDWTWTPEREVSPRPHRNRDTEAERSSAILDAATQLLADGGILAIKGLGGFHLACDATNEAAVSRLRQRKHRWGKPLAIMCRDLDEARTHCAVNSTEESLLTGTVRPIVLLRRRLDAGLSGLLAASVSGDLGEIGVMLPYTPLHHVLLGRVAGPLVMTSGNLSDEPIATGNAEALARLASIADGFLLHDREIGSRYDDSVVRVVDGIVEPVRRSRGYAPFPLALPFQSDVDILACGPEQKNTFTLIRGAHAFVSQHIGDMENADTLESYENTIELYKRLFRVDPKLVAYDLHPEYLSTKFAMGIDLPKLGVQHHHAHVVSVTAERGIDTPVIGVAFDGTGFGPNGTIWGGEVLVADWKDYERVAHLALMPMPGGTGAVRRPARMAIGALLATDLLHHPGAAALRSRLAHGEETLLSKMVENKINTPATSSMGRLFDVVAALAGIRDDAAYEGEAAIELEAAADLDATGTYEFGTSRDPDDGALVLEYRPVLLGVLEDLEQGVAAGTISMRFHRAVVRAIVDTCVAVSERAGTHQVALAGGVFMNRLVFGGAVRDLALAGFEPLTHSKLPLNDGAVSFGQAIIAWARRNQI
ncbi:MAG: carbamoyltransferase HypF, partial [Coriobacteriia bacterium]|nr:carbamoyltransferase HypF [Coriobacteriia bacterium]